MNNTKQKILTAALDLISKQGYAGTSIRQIARKVGVRESAIYNHFKSKGEIFNSIIANIRMRSSSADLLNDDLLNDLTNPEKFLRNLAHRIIDQWGSVEELKIIRLLFMEQFSLIGSKELSISGYLNDVNSICKLILTEMMNNGIIKKGNAEMLAGEFTARLFLIRADYLSFEAKIKTKIIFEMTNKHVEFFWNSIKI